MALPLGLLGGGLRGSMLCQRRPKDCPAPTLQSAATMSACRVVDLTRTPVSSVPRALQAISYYIASPGERCADVHDPLVPHAVRQGELDSGLALVERPELTGLVNEPYQWIA
jgi:hypothetical protein